MKTVSPRTAARRSGSSQMWNLKSGVSLRSSARMESQISSGCVGTGGRDPPRGQLECTLRGRAERGKARPRRPRLGECTTAKTGGARVPGGGPAKREKSVAPGLSRAVDRKCTGGRPAILYPGSAVHEAHLSAKEAQARPHTRVPRAHENPRRPCASEAAAAQGPQAAHALADG